MILNTLTQQNRNDETQGFDSHVEQLMGKQLQVIEGASFSDESDVEQRMILKQNEFKVPMPILVVPQDDQETLQLEAKIKAVAQQVTNCTNEFVIESVNTLNDEC